MNLDIPEFQKTAIIFFIILFFICLFCYYVMYWVQQPNPYTESYVNISDVVQMNNELTIDHPYLKENNTYKWWNAADKPIQVPWKGLQWPIEDDDALKKHNGNFTVSFWIMTHTENEYEFPVFRVLETGSSLNIPGIFLQDNQLYVKTRTDKGNTESSMDSNHKCILQTNRPEFITVSFNNDRCTLYSNGNFKFEHKWSEFPYVLRENDNVVIDVGSVQAWRGSIQRNSYVLHNLTLFHGVLDSGTIASFYTQSKNHYKKTFLRESNGQEHAHQAMDIEKPIPSFGLSGSNTSIVDFYRLPRISHTNQSTMGPDFADSQNDPMKFPLDSHKNQVLYARLFSASKREILRIPRHIQYTEKGLSFALWLKIAPNLSSHAPRVFVCNGNGSYIALYFYGKRKTLYGVVRNTKKITEETRTRYEETGRTHTIFIREVNPYQWYHIVWTLHPTNGWKLFVNGYFYYEFSNVDAPNKYVYPNNFKRTQCIGAQPNGNNAFDGLIADFRIIERALTQEDVTEIYENPVAP